MGRYSFLLLFLLTGRCLGQGQDSLSYAERFEILEAELDTIGLFHLIDDLLAEQQMHSEWAFRLMYNSSVISAGRDFNVRQQGWSPGISYYHKSGAYADWSSYIDTAIDPLINLSLLNVGYIKLLDEQWSINAYYEHNFNHSDSVNIILSDAVGTQVLFDFNLAEINIDYAFLFGQDTGHRMLISLGKSIEWADAPVLKNINFYPSVSASFGTATAYFQRFSQNQLNAYAIELLGLRELTDEEIQRRVREENLSVQQEARLRYARALVNRFDGERTDLTEVLQALNPIDETSVFTLLSYNLSLPVLFNLTPNTQASLSYSYSVPIQLPGLSKNLVKLEPTGYFSFSISHRIGWAK